MRGCEEQSHELWHVYSYTTRKSTRINVFNITVTNSFATHPTRRFARRFARRSIMTVKNRVMGALNEIVKSTPDGEATCVVSHLWVTRSMISDALGLDPSKMNEVDIPTASISCVDYEEGGKAQVVMQGFKPDVGLEKSKDTGN